jgi:two-component system chemotaxis response regulator CheB
MQKLRTLFVTDGPATGGATAAALGADPGIDIVGRVLGAEAGARLVEAEAPDVVVIYASHAAGDGRALLEKTAAARGAPVVAVESHRPPVESFESLRRRVKAAANGGRARPSARSAPGSAVLRSPATLKLIAIGASTGGVEALVSVLSQFPEACPPTVVVQHMPPFFTTSFAARLNAVCRPAVHEAWDGAPLDRGTIYLAPGGATHLEVVWNSVRKVRLVEADPVNRHRPSVDVAFHSVARQLSQGVVGVLLTGMGRDGADGLRAMREAGARTIAQDRDTSTVYGMPRAALENGAVDEGTPLGAIAAAIFDPDQQAKEAMSWR